MDLSYIIKNLSEGSVIRDLSIIPKKWPTLMKELSEICSESHVQEAALDLIEQGSMIMKTDKECDRKEKEEETKPITNSIFNDIESQRILNVLELDRLAEVQKEKKINLADYHINLIEWMLYEIIQRDNDNELLQCLKNVSFIKVPFSKLKMKLSIIKYKPPTNSDNINLSKELMLLIDYFNENPDLTTLLILMKLLLLLAEYEIDICDIDNNNSKRQEKLSQCAALDTNDFKEISDFASKREHAQTFESIPHIVPINGNFTKLTLYEIHGNANGFIGGIHIDPKCDAVYYETNVKGKDLSNIRIGWGLCGTALSKYSEIVGSNKNAWVYEPSSKLLFHDSVIAKSKISEGGDSNLSEKETGDIPDLSILNLSTSESEKVNIDADISEKVEAAAMKFSEQKKEAEDDEDDEGPSSDIDNFDPSLFDTDKDKNIKSFFKFIREEEELTISKIRKIMITKGLTFESIEEFFDEELPNDSLLESILPMERIEFDSKMDQSQDLSDEVLSAGTRLERDDISAPITNSFKAGSVLGCLLLPKLGEMAFFVDGELHGFHKVDADGLVKANECGWQPVFHSSKSSILDFNLGQTEFMHRTPVLEYMVKYDQVSEDKFDISSIRKHSISSFLRFDNASSNDIDKKGVKIRNMSHDTFKSMTFEASLRIVRNDNHPEDNSNSKENIATDYFTLFSIGEINAPENDCSFNIGFDNIGRIYVEIKNCERVVSPSIIPYNWCHFALMYNYHRGSNKSNINILIDGQLKFQHEIVASKKNKITKWICKDLCIGHLLSSNSSFNQLSNSKMIVDICHIRIWTTSRGLESIMNTLGRKKILGYDSDLICELTFDECAGNHIYDIARHKSVLRRKELIEIPTVCKWLILPKEESDTYIFDILYHHNRSHEKQELSLESGSIIGNPLLNTFLSSIVKKIELTCLKILNDKSTDIYSTRKFQNFASGGNYFMNFGEVDLWLINSLWRQVISIEKMYLQSSLFQSICQSLLQVLHVVFTSIRDSKEVTKVNTYSQISQQSRDHWINKISICLIYLSAGCKSNVYDHNFVDLADDAISLFVSGLDVLIPSAENQFYLLECLLIKQFQGKNEIRSKLHFEIFNYLSSSLFDISNIRINSISDPLLLMLSVSTETTNKLIFKLCDYIHKSKKLYLIIRTNLRSIIEPSSKNLFEVKFDCRPVVDRNIEVSVGDVVIRGPNWEYDDEDGGVGALGVVVNIGDWIDSINTKITVLWKNGNINNYRWGVSSDDQNYLYDICIYSSSKYNDLKSSKTSPKLNNTEVENENIRKNLSFTIEEVRDALIDEMGDTSITKRSILTYMKDNSSVEWQEKNKILRSINSLLVKLDGKDIVNIYSIFYETYSNKIMSNNFFTKDLVIIHKIESRSDLLKSGDMYRQRINYFFWILLTYIQNCEGLGYESALRLLITGQAIMLGISKDSSDKINIDSLTNSDSINNSFILDCFESQEGRIHYWNWKNGLLQDKPILNSINSSDVVKPDEIKTENPETKPITEKILNDLTIDSNCIGGNLLVTERSKSVEIIQSGDREWNTCICTTAIYPNSGIYKWYVKIKNFSERRGHCMLGVATSEFSYDEFLGQDLESWGLSPNLDLFHGGRKRKNDDDIKLAVGCTVEVTLDSDKGLLEFREINSSPYKEKATLSFENLKGFIVFPAFSLYSPGDCISIITSLNEISGMLSNKNGLSTNSNSKIIKSYLIVRPKNIGFPSKLLIEYAINMIDTIVSYPINLSTSLTKLQNSFLFTVIYCLMNLFSSFVRWQFISDYKDQIFFNCISSLIIKLNELITNIRENCFDENNSAENVNNDLEKLLMQCTCLASVLYSKMLKTFIVAENPLVSNDQLAESDILEKNKIQSSTLSTSPSNLLKNDRNKHVNINWIESAIFSKGYLDCDALLYNEFAKDILQLSPNISLFLRWISLHDKTHHNLRRFGGDVLYYTVRLLFLVNIYHSGYLFIVHNISNKIREHFNSKIDEISDEQLLSFKPPQFLLTCWEYSVKIRLWAKEKVSTGLSYEYLSQYVNTRSQFLLNFESSSVEKYADTEMPLTQLLLSFNWDLNTTALIENRLIEVMKIVKSFVTDNSSLVYLRQTIIKMNLIAERRIFAFKSIRYMLDNITQDIIGIKCILLSELPIALKLYQQISSTTSNNANFLWGHYTSDLYAISKQLKLELQGAFDLLYNCLAQELLLCNSSTEDNICIRFTLVDCLAVRVLEEDHTMLSRIQLFFVLQEILDVYINNPKSSLVSNDSEGDSSKPKTSSDSHKNIVKAIMKLFILIALQVAIVRDSDDSPKFNNSISAQLINPSIKKTKSGPATLSKAVFDILFAQLNEVSTNIFMNIPSSDLNNQYFIPSMKLSQNSLLIASEATNLLLCVSKNKICQQILIQSNWVVLLLKMSLLGNSSCQQRALLLLSDLLPLIDINSQDNELSNWISNQPIVSAMIGFIEDKSSISKPVMIIKIILSIITNILSNKDLLHMVVLSDKIDFVKEIVDCSLPVISDAIGLIRTLYMDQHWRPIVDTFLMNSIEQYIKNKSSSESKIGEQLLSIVLILGGFIDLPYLLCPVIYQCGSNDEVEFRIGVLSDYQENTERVEISSYDDNINTENKADTLVDTLDKVKAINRYPTEKLILSGEMIETLIRLLKVLLIQGDNKKDDSGGNQCNFTNNLKSFIVSSCLKIFSSLSNDKASMRKIIAKMLDDDCVDKYSSNLLLLELINYSTEKSNAGGLSDISVYEEYLMILMKGRQKLVAVDKQALYVESKENAQKAMIPELSLTENNEEKVERDLVIQDIQENIEKITTNLILNLDIKPSLDPTNEESRSEQIEKHTEECESDPLLPDLLIKRDENKITDTSFVFSTDYAQVDNSNNYLVESLENMGFPRKYCEIALDMCGDDPEEALNYILNNGITLEEMVQMESNNTKSSSDTKKSKAPEGFDERMLEEMSSDNIMHYDGDCNKLLPFYSEPSLSSERLGCIYPGDDLNIIEVVDRNADAQNMWYKLAFRDFDDGSFQKSVSNLFVYVPRYLKGREVIKEGPFQGDSECILSDPPGDTVYVEKHYKIIGVNGALVREGPEIISPEVCSIKTGEIVFAVEEVFNSEGTLRLRLSKPISGYISKLVSLVEKIVDSNLEKLNDEKKDVSDKIYTEIDLLRRIEDNFDVFTGGDAYNKDERYFGSLQGNQYSKFFDRNKTLSQSIYHRRMRISECGTYTNYLRCCNGRKLYNLDEAISKTIKILMTLYCRKFLLSLFLNDINHETGNNELLYLSTVSNCQNNIVEICNDQHTEETKLDCNKSDIKSLLNSSSMAKKFYIFLRFLAFRGEPYGYTGVELAPYNELISATLIKFSLSIEQVLDKIIIPLIKIKPNETSTSVSFRSNLINLFVDSVSRNIRLASSNKYSDYCWSDASYEEDIDFDIDDHPNLNYSGWVTDILVNNTTDQNVIYTLFESWIIALRGSSISQKHISLNNLSNILSVVISSADLSSFTSNLINMLPLERLKRLSTRRLWSEMEDHPLYSRFLQSAINFLSLIDKCNKNKSIDFKNNKDDISNLIDNKKEKLRTVLSFDTLNSYIHFNPQRDLSGAWTLELWLYKRDSNESKIESNTSTNNDSSEISVKPMYLMSSNKYFIKLQHGGTIYNNNKINDPNQSIDPVHDEACCISLGQIGSVEKIVDFRLPTDKWVHLAIVNQISPVSCMSVYVDGEEVDNLSYSMNLPISTLGSQQSNLSFQGDISYFRIWSTSKSAGEIKRDMFLDLQNQKNLIVTLNFSEGSGDLIHDSSGHVNYCKLVNCNWSLRSPPTMETDPDNTFIRSELEDSMQMFDSDHYKGANIFELTGHIKITSIYGLDSAEFNADVGEVIVLCYRFISSLDENHNRNIEGYINWCDRGSRTSILGIVNTFQNSIVFNSIPNSVLFGPPEPLEWLKTFSFRGNIIDSTIKGSLMLDVFAKAPPPLEKGNIRVDKFSLKKNILHSSEFNRKFVKKIEKLAVSKTNVDDGEYVTTIEVFPYKTQQATAISLESYGIVESEGCLWIEFLINSNMSSCISFGICTESSLSHPDSCIDGNDGTWTYTISGQASHGFDLRQCESATEGDIIGLQIDTDSKTVSFFKNNSLIVEFELNFEDDSTGLRPFVSLFSADDSISILGLKEGFIDITYPLDIDIDDNNNNNIRSKLSCELNKGTFNGFGLLTLKNNEKWFGNWVDGHQDGIQLLVADNIENDHINTDPVIDSVTVPTDGVSPTESSTDNNTSIANNNAPVVKFFKLGKLEKDFSVEDMIPLEEIKILKLAILDFMKSRDKKSKKSEVETNSIINPIINTEMSNPIQSPEPQQSPFSIENKINIRVHDGGLDEFIFRIPKNILFQKVIDAYASRKSIPISSLIFKHKDTILKGTDTVDTYDLDENSIVLVSVKSITTDSLIEIDQFINESTAPFILKIKYEAGATVRNGIEIEESSSIRTLKFGEIVEAFKKSYTIEKIGRYQIADGWISEKLRGGSEAKVVLILKEKFKVPLYYKVIRSEGARIRSSALLDSEDVGFCSNGTVIVIDEMRCIEVKTGEEPLKRVKIISPSEHKGWVSLKNHILEQVFDENLLPKDYCYIDPLVQVELERRDKVRLKRRLRDSQTFNSKRINTRRHLQQTTAIMEVSSDTFFLLKKSKLEKTYARISSDFTTVTGDDVNSGRCLVFGNKGFSRGVHYWEVDVKAASWGSVFIGVAPEDASSWNGYGFLNYRATQAFGSETLYGSYFSVNDKVGVLLNMDNGTLSFFKDGEDFNVGKTTVVNMGVAYHNVRKTSNRLGSLFPCLGVKSSSDQLSISKCHWVSSKGLNPDSIMNRVLNSMNYIEKWNSSYYCENLDFMSSELITYMYKVYEQWKNKDIIIVSSRPGIDVILDTSINAIRKAVGVIAIKYDLKVGHVVKTPYGEGKIIGARDFQLWYSVETLENGKWYWNKDELEVLLNSGSVSFENENVNNNEIKSDSEPLEYLSFEQFSKILSQSKFTKEEDDKLCILTNSLAHKYDISPLRISATDIQDYIKNTNILRNHSFEEIQIRYISLCVLNKAAAIILPLVDFNRADFRLPLVQSERKILNLENDPLINIKFNSLSVAATSLSSVKNIIFTQTKLKLWNHAIKETTTSTSAPADEYERPDDLREITINRVEARNMESMKDSLSFDDKMKLSVFGQLRNNMNSWDDRSLRRAFVHMQDAGQARAFFVKFSGEGVDDQGGPYRAVFQTAVEEAIGLLELLVPCPNAKSEMGENRDKFFFNSSLKNCSKNYSSILTFFGKLIGIACRHSIMLPLALPKLIWKPLVGETVDLNDLKSVDINTLNSMNSMTEGDFNEEQITDLLFQALNDIISSSNQPTTLKLKIYDLIHQVRSNPDNNNIINSKSDIMKILILTLHMQSQSDALRFLYKGMASVIPMELMNIFTSDELESILCGEVEVDIAVLKRATVYESVSPTDSHIQFFWESLELLSKEERSQFINFCSGRSRLPAAASEFPMSFKLISPPSYAEKNPDNYLPIARTCFFTLSLPKYTSVEVCVEKLKYAIRNTELMDADFIDRRGTSGWENVR